MAAIRTAFDGRFAQLILNVHTLDRQREIPGKCSNMNSALREAHRQLFIQSPEEYASTTYTVTTCDTDSLFSPNYFQVCTTFTAQHLAGRCAVFLLASLRV